ncbi:MAG: hypothetical protein QOC68_4685, partial [Solirubrobacteraceae bacterium]|nr:hypothetical protein [Solirubrobacteraceae bacterium]
MDSEPFPTCRGSGSGPARRGGLGMSEAPGRRVIAWINSSDQELRVPSYPAGM